MHRSAAPADGASPRSRSLAGLGSLRGKLSHSMGRVRPETNFSLSSSFIARLLVGAKFDLLNLGARQDGAFQEGGEIVAAHAAFCHGSKFGTFKSSAATAARIRQGSLPSLRRSHPGSTARAWVAVQKRRHDLPLRFSPFDPSVFCVGVRNSVGGTYLSGVSSILCEFQSV